MASRGRIFKEQVLNSHPLAVVGTINAYCAKLAESAGFKAGYISGAGVANASYGLPDLGITSLENVLIDLERISAASDLSLLVDADVGWGGAFNIARTVRQMIRHGAAGLHIEDQLSQKRCGHRPNKQIVSEAEMVDRIKAAADARIDQDFVIMARTDCVQKLGVNAAIDRLAAYLEAGADMVFPEALTKLADYQLIATKLPAPVLANITEFGKTPLFFPALSLLKLELS